MNYKITACSDILGSYLHEDFNVPPSTFESAVADMLETDPAILREASRELHALLAEPIGEARLEDITVDGMGVAADPASWGMSYRQWLTWMLSRIDERLARLPARQGDEPVRRHDPSSGRGPTPGRSRR